MFLIQSVFYRSNKKEIKIKSERTIFAETPLPMCICLLEKTKTTHTTYQGCPCQFCVVDELFFSLSVVYSRSFFLFQAVQSRPHPSSHTNLEKPSFLKLVPFMTQVMANDHFCYFYLDPCTLLAEANLHSAKQYLTQLRSQHRPKVDKGRYRWHQSILEAKRSRVWL